MLSLPLYRYISVLSGTEPVIPLPMFNVISGGLHSGGQIDIQDVLVIPTDGPDFATALADAVAVHSRIREWTIAAGHQPLVADEGGWAPQLRSNREAVEWVANAITDTGIEASIAIDIAASQLLDPTTRDYVLPADGRRRTSLELIDDWFELTSAYPVRSIEDGLAEDDWGGWEEMTRRMGPIQLVGDDLFATNVARLQRGIQSGVANAILVKPNQAGTLTEALDVLRVARAHNYRTIVSARSGKTEDAFIADLAVGSAAGQIKVGSVTRSERLAKWNRLLRNRGGARTGFLCRRVRAGTLLNAQFA